MSNKEFTFKSFVNTEFYLDNMDFSHFKDVLKGDENKRIDLYDNNFIQREFEYIYSVKYNNALYVILLPLFDIEKIKKTNVFIFNIKQQDDKHVLSVERNTDIINEITILYSNHIKQDSNAKNFNENLDSSLIC